MKTLLEGLPERLLLVTVAFVILLLLLAALLPLPSIPSGDLGIFLFC